MMLVVVKAGEIPGEMESWSSQSTQYLKLQKLKYKYKICESCKCLKSIIIYNYIMYRSLFTVKHVILLIQHQCTFR